MVHGCTLINFKINPALRIPLSINYPISGKNIFITINKQIHNMEKLINAGTGSASENSIRLLESFSTQQRQKNAYLSPRYGDQTPELVSLIQPRGENSFPVILNKIKYLDETPLSIKKYHDALADNFPLQEIVTPDEIISRTAQVRSDLSLPPYTTRLKQNCESDFFNIFVVYSVSTDVSTGSSSTKTFLGYKPMFKL